MSERVRLPETGVTEQAAYWFTVLRDDDCPVATQKAFELWLDEDPEHRTAYSRVEYAWAATAGLENEPSMTGLRHAAIRQSVKPRFRFGHAMAAAAAAVVVAVVLAALFADSVTVVEDEPLESDVAATTAGQAPDGNPVIETAVGERSTFQLSDGSSVDLNTATRLRVAFDEERRSIVLLEGQALFDVAQDPNRPFVVFARDRKITAIGTQFEVRLDRKDVAVTLIEGKVEVARLLLTESGEGAEAPQAIELEAGQRVSGELTEAQSVSEDELSRALSWREGRLDFENEALADVVYEINRYSTDKVHLADATLGELRVSGSFKAGSVENFVLALTEVYPLKSREEAARSGGRNLVVYSGSDEHQ